MCWQGRVPRSRALIFAVVARNPTINSFCRRGLDSGGWDEGDELELGMLQYMQTTVQGGERRGGTACTSSTRRAQTRTSVPGDERTRQRRWTLQGAVKL